MQRTGPVWEQLSAGTAQGLLAVLTHMLEARRAEALWPASRLLLACPPDV